MIEAKQTFLYQENFPEIFTKTLTFVRACKDTSLDFELFVDFYFTQDFKNAEEMKLYFPMCKQIFEDAKKIYEVIWGINNKSLHIEKEQLLKLLKKQLN